MKITESPAIGHQHRHHLEMNEITVIFKEPNANYTYVQIISTNTKVSYMGYITYQIIDMDEEINDPGLNQESLPIEGKSDTTKWQLPKFYSWTKKIEKKKKKHQDLYWFWKNFKNFFKLKKHFIIFNFFRNLTTKKIEIWKINDR